MTPQGFFDGLPCYDSLAVKSFRKVFERRDYLETYSLKLEEYIENQNQLLKEHEDQIHDLAFALATKQRVIESQKSIIESKDGIIESKDKIIKVQRRQKRVILISGAASIILSLLISL